MRDLFQVVFALKKKEIEVAKQNLDKSRFTSSPLFSDTLTISKVCLCILPYFRFFWHLVTITLYYLTNYNFYNLNFNKHKNDSFPNVIARLHRTCKDLNSF